MTGKRGFSLFEMLIVVAIMGIVAVAAVPVAEITYIKTQETLLEKNLEDIRTAISLWKRDCRNVVVAIGDYNSLYNINDSQLYPPSLEALVKPGEVYPIVASDGVTHIADFRPQPYLQTIPQDPFVGAAKWVVHYASGTTGIYSGGITKPDDVNASGVLDVSCVDNTDNQRRGFVTAIDGTKYEDW